MIQTRKPTALVTRYTDYYKVNATPRAVIARIECHLFSRFEVHSVEGAFGRLTYELIIHGVEEEDYGVFECRIKNTEGTTSKLIRLESESHSIYQIDSLSISHAVFGQWTLASQNGFVNIIM